MKSRLINYIRREDGFTIIDTIFSVAISVIIMSGLFAGIYQLMNGRDIAQDKINSIQQVQNSGYWISRDTLMAQTLVIGDDAGTPEYEEMTINWVGANRNDGQYDYSDSHQIRYILDTNTLLRNEHITTEKYDSDGILISTDESEKTLFISENITDITSVSANGTVALVITSAVGESQNQKKYEITPRALDS